MKKVVGPTQEVQPGKIPFGEVGLFPVHLLGRGVGKGRVSTILDIEHRVQRGEDIQQLMVQILVVEEILTLQSVNHQVFSFDSGHVHADKIGWAFFLKPDQVFVGDVVYADQ